MRASRLWSNRQFLRLWAAQATSECGSGISALAIPWIGAVLLDASPLEFSMLGVADFLPFLLVSLPAGAFADRFPARRILVTADLIRMSLLLYLPLAWYEGWLDILQLLGIQLALGICTVLFDVAYVSALPSIVEPQDLGEANARLQTSASAAAIGGPPLAGALVAAVSAPLTVIADAGTFLVSAYLLRALPDMRSDDASIPNRRLLRDIRDGLAFVVHHRCLRAVAASAAISNFASQVVYVVGFLYMRRVLAFAPSTIGFVLAGLGTGALIASLSSRFFERRLRFPLRAQLTMTLLALTNFVWPLVSAADAAPALFAATLLGGFASMSFNIAQLTMRQTVTPAALQGRMHATMRWITWGAVPLGGVAGGAIASIAGLHAALWTAAVAGLAATVPLMARGFRQRLDVAHKPR